MWRGGGTEGQVSGARSGTFLSYKGEILNSKHQTLNKYKTLMTKIFRFRIHFWKKFTNPLPFFPLPFIRGEGRAFREGALPPL